MSNGSVNGTSSLLASMGVWKKTVISAVVLGILVGVYVIDHEWTKRKREAKERSELAFPFKEDDATTMTLVSPTEIITVAKVDKDRWVMTQPLETAADKDAITVILGNLLPAKRHGEFEMDETVKEADYGFDAPTYTLIVRTPDVPQGAKLLIGKQAPQSGKFYAKLDGEKKIFAINEWVKDKLDVSPFDLRDRQVLPVAVDDVQRVVLARSVKKIFEIKSTNDEGATVTTTGSQRKPEKIVIDRDEKGGWKIEEPLAWKGDSIEIEDMLSKVKNAKVTAFVDEPSTATDYGFPTPQIDLRIEQRVKAGDGGTTPTSQTQTLVLLVGDRETSPGKDYFARRGDDAIVTINRDLFDALTVKDTKLRDKQIFGLRAGDVTHFELEGNKGKVELDKNDEGQWAFAGDAATSVDQNLVDDKIADLVNQRLKDFETDDPRDLKQFELDEPRLRLLVADKDRRTIEGLEIGKNGTRGIERFVYARLRRTNSVVRLDVNTFEDFDLGKDDFVDKSLFRFEEDDVARADVVRGRGTTFTLTREGIEWRIQRAGDEKPARVPMTYPDMLTQGMRELKYANVFQELKLTDEKMGLSSPTLEIVLFNKDNAELARVIRGTDKADLYYTRIQPDGPIYGVETSAFSAIESAIESLLKEQ